jgi:aarF domain-containing kinase
MVKKYVAKHIELTLRENIMRQKLTDQERIDEWNQIHDVGSTKLHDTIRDMKGFYVKAAQIVSSRGDLFPSQSIDKLGRFTENLEPMSIDLVKEVVAQDLLPNGKDKFEDVFTEFDDIPLGSASIGQVHRAVLSAKYGGKEVAVKVQRPSIEEKLLGDVANLKAITKPLRGLDALPVDYYTIFCELEKQLANEFDFLGEAAAMTKFHYNLHHRASGTPDKVPLVMPLPVDGLVSKRVLTMDLLKGASLQQKFKEMEEKGIDSSSPEAKLFGRKLLRTLTDVFGRSILEHGFFHADAHPGNIWIHEDGSIGLIDFGQVKSISDTYRKTLAQAVLSIAPTEDDGADIEALWQLMHDLGIVVKDGAPREAGAALGMWMFDGSATTLPGNYDAHELSPKSPVRDIETFPEDLVLIARSSVLVKGMGSRLNVPWSLAKEWRQLAEDVVRGEESNPSHEKTSGKRRLAMKRLKQLGSSSVKKLPAPVRSRVASIVLKVVERRERK